MKYIVFLGLVLVAFNACARTFGGDPEVDLSIKALTLSASNEKSFTYTFNLTNSGIAAIQGYAMKLTFSSDKILDAGDDFFVITPLKNDASQAIGANQTLAKNVQYAAASPVEYLPAGSWYVFAEINYDRAVSESDYLNNTGWSTNKITVSNYTINFDTNPEITSISESSFVINATFDTDMTRIYYQVLVDGAAAPDKGEMQFSNVMFPWETQVLIPGLGPAFNYDVYCMGEFYDQKVTGVYKLDVKTLGTATPTLVLSSNALTLPATSVSGNSASEVYSIKGFHLTADVTVKTSGNFAVSKDDQTYVNQVTFPVASITQGKSQAVFVRFTSDGAPGIKSGVVTNSSAGATDKPIAVSLSVFDPENLNFDGLSSLEETGWSAYNVTGYHAWSLVDLQESSPHQRVTGNDKALQIDGSINGFTENEDWLISPRVDLSEYAYEPTIGFKSYSSGLGQALKLKYSADYSGTGNPREANWFDAACEFPEVNSNAWKKSSAVILNKESSIFFAFVYTSTTSAGSRWTIDDWRISDNLLNIPTTPLSYQNVEVGTSSDAQAILVKIVGYGDVTVTVSEGFQISLDNSTFSASVVISETDVEVGKTIYVRFTPLVQTPGLQGTLTFSANDLSVTRNTLIGTSLLTTSTGRTMESADLVYPNPTSGAVRINLRLVSGQEADFPIVVVNSLGSTVAEFQSSTSSMEDAVSDVVMGLRPGVYYLTIQLGNTVYRDKIIKL